MRAELRMPAASVPAHKPPLVVILQGNEPSPDSDPNANVAAIVDGFERANIATLAVWFNADDREPLRRVANDVARLIATSVDDRFARVTLVGRGLGATVAALLGLDERLANKRIAGVIGVRGTYDLRDLEGHHERDHYAALKTDDASPMTFVRAGAPPFLLLNAGDDGGSWPRLSRTFARALEKAGTHAEAYVIPDRNRDSITYWSANSELGRLVHGFVASGPTTLPIDTMLGVRQRWTTKPPIDHDAFRSDASRIQTHPVDSTFIATLMVMFQRWPFELNVLPGKTYQAIELLPYLASRPESEVGKGDWLVVANIRGEQQYFTREDLEKTKPVVVVGMDDETNLHRLFTPYRLKRTYSWKNEPQPPFMVRPLGAFLHFRGPGPLPAHLQNKSYAPYGLTPKSFRWVQTDPLAKVRDLTGPASDALIGEQGCVKCHSFRGIEVKAHHVLASDGTSAGAFALPLEEYPTEVLRRFLFEQEAVAKSFDVSPLRVDPAAARALFDLVPKH